MITIINKETDEILKIHRDVCHEHPQWVHDQLGTKSEAELQQYLSTLSVKDYYDNNGNHLGEDVDGLSIYDDKKLGLK